MKPEKVSNTASYFEEVTENRLCVPHNNNVFKFPLNLQGIITLVLATDMARHGEILTSFKEKLENFDFTNDQHLAAVSKNPGMAFDLKH